MLAKPFHFIRRPSPPEARQILSAIVASLPADHQRGIAAYYCTGAGLEAAAESAAMGVDAFRQLKHDLRARLAAAIRKLPEESFGDSVAAVMEPQPAIFAQLDAIDLFEIDGR